MKRILRNLKLIQDFTTEIPIDKSLFVTRLQSNVAESGLGFFSDLGEAFTSNKKEFKGQVGYEGFKIRRRRRLFDMNMASATARGTYRQKGDLLVINAEVDGFSRGVIPFLIFAGLAYLIGFGTIISSSDHAGYVAIALPALLLHAAFMLGFPYLMMRKGIARTKHELEREFYYLTKERRLAEHEN